VKWIVKASAQKLLSSVPRGSDANFVLQYRLTKSLPQRDPAFRRKVSRAVQHFRAFREHGTGKASSAVFYEFGTGWDLVVPLVYWSLGIDRQILADIRPNLRLELVNDTVTRFERLRPELEEEAGFPLRSPGTRSLRSTDELRTAFGIEYRAPTDARATGLPAGSVDFVSSTNVLEHIPEPHVEPILAECRRLLAPAGVLSCRVDLKDHYSYFDASISAYNFLRFPDDRWRLANSSLHYQNRLRASDYRRLLDEAGFELVADEAMEPTEADLELLAELPLAPRFRSYTLRDLGVKALALVARPRAS
jgi:SAM-dependent methyltransferase